MGLQLLLVRHGESAGNHAGMFTGHSPSPLTARGRAQAEAVAVALGDPPPDAIYASDLVRAVDTAAPLAARTGRALITREALRERDMGAWAGVTFTEVQSRWPEDWKCLVARDPDHVPPGGESHRACGVRVATAIDAIVRDHPAGRVVVVSHGVAIHHMLRHLLKIPSWQTLFQVDNASVQRLAFGERGTVRVLGLNDARHLLGVEA